MAQSKNLGSKATTTNTTKSNVNASPKEKETAKIAFSFAETKAEDTIAKGVNRKVDSQANTRSVFEAIADLTAKLWVGYEADKNSKAILASDWQKAYAKGLLAAFLFFQNKKNPTDKDFVLPSIEGRTRKAGILATAIALGLYKTEEQALNALKGIDQKDWKQQKSFAQAVYNCLLKLA